MNFEKPKKSEFCKNETKKKKKKLLEILSFYTCVPKTSIIWGTVHELRRMKKWKLQKKPLEIPSFYTILPKIIVIDYTVPKIWHVIDVIVIFHFGLFFAFLPPKSPKNKISKKNEKALGDIIILHMCTKNYD